MPHHDRPHPHSLHRSIRSMAVKVLLVLAVAGIGMAVSAQPAQAQAPAKDEEMREEQSKNMILRLGEWYGKVKEWRETALDNAEKAIDETERVKKLRENYEERAIGELGKLGEQIPEWRNYMNTCAILGGGDSDSTSSSGLEGAIEEVCGGGKASGLVSKYEEVLIDEVEKFKSEVFAEVDSIDAETDKLIREQAGEIAGDVIGDRGKAQLEPEIQSEARHATRLDTVAARVDSVIASLVEKEVGTDSTGKKEISSGRANQISAWIAWGEAEVALEELRSATASSRRKAIERAETNREERTRDWVIINSLTKP